MVRYLNKSPTNSRGSVNITRGTGRWSVISLLEMKPIILLLASTAFLTAQDGAVLYQQICASCHEGGADRAPTREALRAMTPDRVLAALETGAMITMTSRRTAAERRAIAEFVTGKSLSQKLETAPKPQAMCREGAGQFTLNGPLWNGWGQNTFNARFQDAAAARLTAAQVPRLKLKWAFGFPGELISNAQASLAGGRVFVGSGSGVMVYSLDAASGCIHWYFQAASWVRSGISIGRIGTNNLAYFGDGVATAYAVDAATGKLLWKAKVDDYPVARVTGSPTLHNGRLYVPVASGEEGAGAAPDYECCRFRGSVVALDAATGKQIWKTYTIDPPKPTKKNKMGTQLWGPSGAPVWTAPAIDTKRNALYVTTGDNYEAIPPRAPQRRVHPRWTSIPARFFGPARGRPRIPTTSYAACPTRPTVPIRTVPISTSLRPPFW